MKAIKENSPALVTTARLKEVLHYEAGTGIFVWLVNRGKARVGNMAGRISNKGYIQIEIDRRLYSAHRLAWLYQFDRWPSGQIDHINGDPIDNRIANLREATHAQNMQNRKVNVLSGTGVIGVRRRSKSRGYVAEISINGRKLHLGTYRTVEEASAAYQTAARNTRGAFIRDVGETQ